MELPEPAQLVDRQRRIPQVQQRVLEHRAVTVRQHEAIAIRPVRIRGVVSQMARPQRNGDVGHAHRHAGMPGFGRFDRVHRQRANRIGKIGVAHLRGGLYAECRNRA